MNATETELRAGRTQCGYVVQVVGSGTMRESYAVRDFAAECLPESNVDLTLDLSACTYLDSTFLGGLVALQKQFSDSSRCRVTAVIPEANRNKLLGSSNLQRFLTITADAPAVIGDFERLPVECESKQLGRHVARCHHELGELDIPQRETFRRIAEKLDAELGAT